MEIHRLRSALGALPLVLCLLPLDRALAVSDGYVVRVESPTVYLDWGKASGIQRGDAFTVYRPGAELKHPVTGAVLGREEETVASGDIETVEDKFSIGHLIETRSAPRAGDRTRVSEDSVSPAAPSLSQLPASAAANPSSGSVAPLIERWRSPALSGEAVGLALADLDGDGAKEIVVAYRSSLEVFRCRNGRLESLGTFKHKTYRHWLGVEAADLKHDGREELFATAFFDAIGRPRVVALRWGGGALKSVGEIEGFVRSIQRADASNVLVWQNLSRTREVSMTAPQELVFEKGHYQTGPALAGTRLLRDDQLFGYTFGAWDEASAQDLAVLQGGERLRVFFKGMKWSSSESFGGTQDDFSANGGSVISFLPRLINYRPVSGTSELIVPRNIPELGIRFAHLKIYKRSEITGLVWNGLEMAPAWKQPLAGYLADDDTGDALGDGSRQLWTATVNSGGKTVLVAYALP